MVMGGGSYKHLSLQFRFDLDNLIISRKLIIF